MLKHFVQSFVDDVVPLGYTHHRHCLGPAQEAESQKHAAKRDLAAPAPGLEPGEPELCSPSEQGAALHLHPLQSFEIPIHDALRPQERLRELAGALRRAA